jgi:hypothetical protein
MHALRCYANLYKSLPNEHVDREQISHRFMTAPPSLIQPLHAPMRAHFVQIFRMSSLFVPCLGVEWHSNALDRRGGAASFR